MLFLYAFLLITAFSFAQGVEDNIFELLNSDYDRAKIKVLHQIRGAPKKSVVTYIVDGENHNFLIKQATRSNPKGLLLAIRDMVAAHIAESNEIPANLVRLIPKGESFPGKFDERFPATLHLYVSGAPLQIDADLFLQQPFHSYFPNHGITRKVVQDMATHPDLSRIVAFDTFIGNRARRLTSLFYDQNLDRFFAFDLESSFVYPLPQLACSFFQELINNVNLTENELKGLIIYRDTLSALIKNHSPEQQYSCFDRFTQEAGINLRNRRVIRELNLYKRSIRKNYKYSQKLARLLDQLITPDERLTRCF